MPGRENVFSLNEFRKKREEENKRKDDAMHNLVDLGEREIHATADLVTWTHGENAFTKEIFMEPEELVATRGLTVADERDEIVEWLNQGSEEHLERLKVEGRSPEKIEQELLDLFREMTVVFRTVHGISKDEWQAFLEKTGDKDKEFLTKGSPQGGCESYIDFAGIPPDGIKKEWEMKWLAEWWHQSKELFHALTELGTAQDEATTSTLNFVRKLAQNKIQEIEDTYGSGPTLARLIQEKRFEMVLKLLDRANIPREQWREFIDRGEF